MKRGSPRLKINRLRMPIFCIDMTLPQQERIKSYVEQIGNPYCYLDGDIVVTIGYADTDVSLQDRLKSYISNLK